MFRCRRQDDVSEALTLHARHVSRERCAHRLEDLAVTADCAALDRSRNFGLEQMEQSRPGRSDTVGRQNASGRRRCRRGDSASHPNRGAADPPIATPAPPADGQRDSRSTCRFRRIQKSAMHPAARLLQSQAKEQCRPCRNSLPAWTTDGINGRPARLDGICVRFRARYVAGGVVGVALDRLLWGSARPGGRLEGRVGGFGRARSTPARGWRPLYGLGCGWARAR